MNYALRKWKAGEDRFKQCFHRVLEKEEVEMVLAAVIQAALFGINYSGHGDLRITQIHGYVTTRHRAYHERRVSNRTDVLQNY